MHVISKKHIREAQQIFPRASSALEGWYKIISKNNFKNFAELKKTFNHIDKVKN